ncbi:MAG: NAD-dependent epimerase/dehydratase family protein, partial [Actinomycetota bacterium]
MKILVTGGAGFIGSHIVDRMLDDGHDIAVVDSLLGGKRANLAGAISKGARLHVLDIRDEKLRGLIADEQPEVIMHLAAQIDVRISVTDPILDADVNIAGSLNMLEAAREVGVRKVIMTSSGGCIYGEPKTLPVKETYRGVPDSPYGISKKVLHDYLTFYRKTHGVDFTVLALANVYGARQDPTGEAGVVAIFLGTMLAGGQPVIYGDGKQTRDFVHVSDVVEAFSRAIDRGSGTVYNIGTTNETNVLE